jgi:hypothetical protein
LVGLSDSSSSFREVLELRLDIILAPLAALLGYVACWTTCYGVVLWSAIKKLFDVSFSFLPLPFLFLICSASFDSCT